MIIVPKVWGFEKIVVNSHKHNYCGKHMVVWKGGISSFHNHNDPGEDSEKVDIESRTITNYHTEKSKDEVFLVTLGRGLLITSEEQAFERGKETFHLGIPDSTRSYPWKNVKCCNLPYNLKIVVPGDIIHLPKHMFHAFLGLENFEFMEFSSFDFGYSLRLTDSQCEINF